MKKLLVLSCLFFETLVISRAMAQPQMAQPNGAQSKGAQSPIPAVLSGLSYNAEGKLILSANGHQFVDLAKKDMYPLSQMTGNPTGDETGIQLDINMPEFNGTVAYGPYIETGEYPTVAFLPKDVKMKDGKALLEIKKVFVKSTDFFKLAEKGKGILGYRIMDSEGRIIYEGRIAFQGKGPYQVLPTIIQGPMVNNLEASGCVLSYETQVPVRTSVTVDGKVFSDDNASTHHELSITGLQPATQYSYTVAYGDRTDTHSFQTAPKEGSRKPFTFAFASANRATTGGGERDFGGTNYASTRAVMAAAV